MEIWELGAKNIREQVLRKEISAQEVLDSFLARTAEIEPKIHAYIELIEPQARLDAARVDALIMRGEDPGPLAGLPVALKDNLNLKGVQCTCASRILEGYISPYDATAVKKLRKAGAVFTGKTNCDEFAMGSSTENSAFGVTRNPWDLQRVPGGSSGGSAAAVAAGMAPLSLGSDTGGSIRQPASFTGVCGLKPTYGRVSRYGLVAFGSSLDQIGPFGNSVWDCALALEAIAGEDPRDGTTSKRPVPRYTEGLKRPVKGLVAGVPREMMELVTDPGVRREFERALKIISDLGVTVVETSLPTTEYCLDVYYIIAPSEASSNLARFDGVRYGRRAKARDLDEMYYETRGQGFGIEVQRRIMLGTFALSAGYYDAYYLRAARIRTLVRRDFDKAFAAHDVLLSPTAPMVAFKIGERVDDPLAMYAADVLTVPVNLAGIPALSVPCGFSRPDESGPELPCGLQIMGKPYDEETVLALGYAFEEACSDWFVPKTAAMRKSLSSQEECEVVVRDTI